MAKIVHHVREEVKDDAVALPTTKLRSSGAAGSACSAGPRLQRWRFRIVHRKQGLLQSLANCADLDSIFQVAPPILRGILIADVGGALQHHRVCCRMTTQRLGHNPVRSRLCLCQLSRYQTLTQK